MSGLTAVVLAGGQGTRLRPLTLGLPKPMLPVLNRPFLEYLLERLSASGVDRVILALGYEPDPLVRHFGDGEAFGLHIEYAVEEQPLGTSGAVRALLPDLHETFLVLNGDCIATLDIRALVEQHMERREYATLAIHTVEDPSPFGLVITDGEDYVIQFVEKPKGPRFRAFTINTGVYALEPEALRFAPEGRFSMFERDLFPTLLDVGIPIHSFPWQGYFSDMGTPASYLDLHRDMLLGRVPGALPSGISTPSPSTEEGRGKRGLGSDVSIDPTATVEGPAVFGEGVRIGPGAHIVGPVSMGTGCVVEDGASVADSVLWEGVHVGRNASAHGAVLGRDVHIGDGAIVTEGTVLANGERVPAGARLDAV